MGIKSTFLLLLLAGSFTTFAQLGPLTSGEAPTMEGSEDILVAQYRALRTSGNIAQEEVRVGVQPLTSAGNRTDGNLTYGSTIQFTLSYNKGANTLTLTSVINGTTYTTTRNNISGIATGAGKTQLNALNFLELELRTQGNTTGTITVSNLVLDGQTISGSYVSGSGNSNTSRFFYLDDYNFSNGFTLTGTIGLTGSFGNNAENNSVVFTIGSNPPAGGPLPVKWGNVQVSRGASGNHLVQWTTLEEVNTDRFIVQRSTNGRNFSDIGEVSAKGGGQSADYQFEDPSAAGAVYYRIVEIALDGKPSYSRIVSIKGAAVSAVVYDGRNTVRVQTAGNAPRAVQVLDMNGRLMLKARVLEGTTSVDVGSLMPGVYLVRVEGESSATRFVKR
ncbi:MAG TPA: T9SS type A sorting domain-containing protein [Chitinophagaceae bacterium]|nr:T9SS type A sorting domain-containing protein [Chitinophagaceae bacterium]